MLLLVLTFTAVETLAQPYPARPIRVIAAQSAGSSLDTITRIVTNKMSTCSDSSWVIDNRAAQAAHRPGDRRPGHTRRLHAGGRSAELDDPLFVHLQETGLRHAEGFRPISMTVNADSVMAVHPSVPARSVKELIELAKSQPGNSTCRLRGVGSSSHLAGVMFTSMAGIDTVHVPYKGGGPMASAIVAGEAQWCIAPAAALVGHVKAGRMRASPFRRKTRSPLLPDLPTIDEAGCPATNTQAGTASLCREARRVLS